MELSLLIEPLWSSNNQFACPLTTFCPILYLRQLTFCVILSFRVFTFFYITGSGQEFFGMYRRREQQWDKRKA